MATAPVLETAVNLTRISFKDGKPIANPVSTPIVPGQGVIFYTDSDCIMEFANERVFGTRCVWLAANKKTVLYPVATSENTQFHVHASNHNCESKSSPPISSPHILSSVGTDADKSGDPPVGDVG
jgi:hypothetical protein